MTTKIKNKSNTERDQILNQLETFVQFLSHDIQTSKILSENEMTNDLIKIIDESIKQPLNAVFTTFELLDGQIRNLLSKYVLNFFETHKDLIYKVYASSNELHFTIILKKENSSNRMKLLEFLMMYNQISFSEKIPMWFQFAPKEMEELLNKESNLILG